jgi:hypothetical protein
MACTATIGAPSLVGRSANVLSAAEFAGAAYPIKVKFTNLMPRELALPEVHLTLGHCAGGLGRTATATKLCAESQKESARSPICTHTRQRSTWKK